MHTLWHLLAISASIASMRSHRIPPACLYMHKSRQQKPGTGKVKKSPASKAQAGKNSRRV